MKISHFVCFFTLVAYMLLASFAHAQNVEWIRQIGSSSDDYGSDVSVDGLGSVFISGSTRGSLGGFGRGGTDAYVRKFDTDGNLAWTRQFGTSSNDYANGVFADNLGNLFVSGETSGSLGGPNAGGQDAYVRKLDAAGNRDWDRQLGSTNYDNNFGVSVDDLGSVFISGWTFGSLGGPNAGNADAFVSKYDVKGNFAWTRQLGTAAPDYSTSVSADGFGNVFISGSTVSTLGGISAGGQDAYVSKFDAVGNLVWTSQIGTSKDDAALGVSADRLGNVFISGSTVGSMEGINAGGYDAFVSKFDAVGNLAWTRQIGTFREDYSPGVSADGQGSVFISGSTRGSLGVGDTNAGRQDAFVSKFDAVGNLAWTRQIGTSSKDYSTSVIADGLGNVFIAGETWGSLGGINTGGADAFLVKINDSTFIPEPSSTTLLLTMMAGLTSHRRPVS